MDRRQHGQQRRTEEAPDTFATTSMVTELLNSSSSFVVPSGSSSPTTQQSVDASFLSPKRPKSTPFPYPASDRGRRIQPYDLNELNNLYDSESDQDVDSDTTLFDSINHAATSLDVLPVEIQEAILDHLFGFRVSTTSISGMQISSMGSKSWSTAMRHSRRRELTELALVSPMWRVLVQQRLYRHIKLKGTVDFLEDAMLHFARHEHLRSYVRHVEIWFPVFQPRYGTRATPTGLSLLTVTTDGLTNATYILPRNKCTLEEAFRFMGTTLPRVRVLTLEGGERRKAPKVVHLPDQDPDPRVRSQFESLPNVKTLITRGQWNLMRDNRDFATILGALPNLSQWHGSYSKPKSKSYITVSQFLPQLPHHITDLKLCMESDYSRESVMPPFFCKAAETTHICSTLAEATTSLEHFSYTGRICHVLFDGLARLTEPRNTRLQTIDLTVKNCCRPLARYHESGSGIQNMGFIDAFEKLVLAAIRSLSVLKHVQYLRIRFVDLGKPSFPFTLEFRLLTISRVGIAPAESLLPPAEQQVHGSLERRNYC